MRSRYTEAVEIHTEQLRRAVTLWRGVGWFRGGSFLLALVPLLLAVTDFAGRGTLWWWLFAVALAAFIGIAGYHETLADRIRTTRLLLRLQLASLYRFDRRLADLEDPIPPLVNERIPLSKDLDLCGPHSLYRLLGTARTPMGRQALLDWMFEPADSLEIQQRQGAIQALRPETAWRDRFILLCERLAAGDRGPSNFVEWCQAANWTVKFGWVLWLSRLAGAVILILLIGMVAGLLSLEVAGPILLAAAGINFLLSVLFAGSIHDRFHQISSRHEETACYQSLFGEIEACPAHSSRLETLRTRLFETGQIARAMTSLGRLVWWANIRKNSVFFLIYIGLQLVFFWDVHILALLEHWKDRYGASARQWFVDLGEWEALTALSKLAADHPTWCFPTVHNQGDGPAVLRAVGLGHPLLPQDRRVDNDVRIGPTGTFLLVTGSNMSGKSTLLRSIGLNTILAQMGSVVCAQEMSLPCLYVDTSMRISDSLASGVSFFMAELQRLKEIVDRSRRQGGDSRFGHLFLLDEILQGTNSRERQIAVAHVVRQLIDQQSLGAISTHDLELADVASLAGRCEVVHFTESFDRRDGQEVMTFDYRMHRGVAPTTNALKLLELVGLGSPSAPRNDRKQAAN